MGFSTILIANRGEIACRVIRSARAKGYATVAIASEADRDALHVALADEAVIIGPATAAQSYLDADKVIGAARRTGADAVHPGYGFLSENADFAQACRDAGLTFIGPSPDAIRIMGSKAEAKKRMRDAGVPCVPGYEGDDQSEAVLLKEAARIGFPVMVKAAAGGGGRGIRLVSAPEDLPAAIRSARSEARAAFGDDLLILEKAIAAPRHVEVQIVGDRHGAILHLGERDCSLQRRHQKVIEECPSPAVNAALRAELGAAAVEAARTVAYQGVGTVEFLLDPDGQFYFLEMNTRLQVEHPVTEMVTGIDLVGLQLDVAAGRALPFTQGDVTLTGHAIEARLYAEDPAAGFLPCSGRILHWRPGSGEGVRVDHGLDDGAVIGPHYDPMLAKIVAHGADREEARRRLIRALHETRVLGVTTNKAFLISLLERAAFVAGEATTALIDASEPAGPDAAAPLEMIALAAVLMAERDGKGWRSSGQAAHRIAIDHAEQTHALTARREAAGWTIDGLGDPIALALVARDDRNVRWISDGRIRSAAYALEHGRLWLDAGDGAFVFRDDSYAPLAPRDGARDGALHAPMSGTVIAVSVGKGERVSRGQTLLVLEAMKMEHQIVAGIDGVVEDMVAVVGAQVDRRALLASIAPVET
jgi:geranyl-CoA carboxylase alpha subunit